VAAIRSTGLTASLGIAERVCKLVAGDGDEKPLEPLTLAPRDLPWWRRTAQYRTA
jgi:hypothetical protein